MYAVTIKDRADRISFISQEKKKSENRTEINYRGEQESLPVVRLPINVPIYRMLNGRTSVEQSQYIEEKGAKEDFFEHGQENITAQKAQHSILVRVARDPKGNIYAEMAKVGRQDQPLLITSDGVVLNGNRRLAAMRDLYSDDSKNYPGYAYVNAAVLPPEAREEDLELIEAELQERPETKLDYGWIERRLKLRYRMHVLKIDRTKLKDAYRFRREEDMNAELQQLTLAEEYLDKVLRRPRAYKDVAKAEQIFKELQKALKGKSGEEAEVRRKIGFLLIKEAAELGDRAYKYNPIFGSDFSRVIERFIREENLNSAPATSPAAAPPTGGQIKNDDDDPLAGLEDAESAELGAVKKIIDDPTRSKEVAKKLKKIFESVTDERKDDDAKLRALRHAEEALRLVTDVDIPSADPSTLPQLKGQLQAIHRVATNLLAELEKPRKK